MVLSPPSGPERKKRVSGGERSKHAQQPPQKTHHTGGRFSGGGGGADTTVKLRAGRVYRFAVTSNPPLSFEEAATIRTRRAECYEPSFVESCCGSCCCSFGGGGRAGGAGGVKYADLSATEWSDGATLFAVTPASGSGSRVGGGGGGGAAGAAPAPTPAAGVGAVCLEWACDVEPTGRGLRGEIEIELRARGGYGAVRLALQAKVYGGGAKDGGRAARHGVALKAVEYACVRHGITGANRVLATTYLQR